MIEAIQKAKKASVGRRNFLKKAPTGAAVLMAGNPAVKAQSSGFGTVTARETADISGLLTELMPTDTPDHSKLP